MCELVRGWPQPLISTISGNGAPHTVVTSVAVLLATLPQRGHLGCSRRRCPAVPAMQAIFEALDGIESDMAGASGQRTTRARHWTSALQPWLLPGDSPAAQSFLVEWVLLTYHMPRDPSTPRSAVWRKLRRLGVAQLADGLVAHTADARTKQLDWLAVEIREAAGTCRGLAGATCLRGAGAGPCRRYGR